MRMTNHVKYTIECLMQLNVTFEVTPETILITPNKEEVYAIQFRDGIAEVSYRYYGMMRTNGVLQHKTPYTIEETPKMCTSIKENLK